MVMRAAGLQGAADDRDPQVPGAAVVVQEPAAGNLVPRDSVVWFRTRTDVQANGVVRRLRLGTGQTTATYLVVAPDPPTHPLTVVVILPRAAEVKVWLETEFKSRVPVVGRRQDPASCTPAGGQVRCVVQLGAVNAGGGRARHLDREGRQALIVASRDGGDGQVRAAMSVTCAFGSWRGDSNPNLLFTRQPRIVHGVLVGAVLAGQVRSAVQPVRSCGAE
jgi:hypothetical protein